MSPQKNDNDMNKINQDDIIHTKMNDKKNVKDDNGNMTNLNNNIDKNDRNLDTILKEHSVIMQKLDELKENRNKEHDGEFYNNLILNNQFLIHSFKVEEGVEINKDSIIINKKMFNKYILNKIYELLDNKKRVRIKDLFNLFNLDEFRCSFILYEVLNALNTYLNEKLKEYNLTKIRNGTYKKYENEIRNENFCLFNKYLIVNNRDKINITKVVLKIQSLITEILSDAMNGNIVDEKDKSKKKESISSDFNVVNNVKEYNIQNGCINIDINNYFKGEYINFKPILCSSQFNLDTNAQIFLQNKANLSMFQKKCII